MAALKLPAAQLARGLCPRADVVTRVSCTRSRAGTVTVVARFLCSYAGCGSDGFRVPGPGCSHPHFVYAGCGSGGFRVPGPRLLQ